MIHLPALPGAPLNVLKPKEIIEKALREASIYQKFGIAELMIENMHDVPYSKNHVTPEVLAVMTLVGYELKKRFPIKLGIQVLAGANKEALAAAFTAGLDFIRAEGFVFGHLADEGYMESCAAELLRYRKELGAEHVSVFTDVKKKHSSHAITADVSLYETAKAAEFFLSDGIIVTGISTGNEPSPMDVKLVKGKVKIPVLVGSGITPENISDFFDAADGFIVGSALKKERKWYHEPDEAAIEKMVNTFARLKD